MTRRSSVVLGAVVPGLLGLLVAAAVAALLAPAVALAHSAEGTLTLLRAEQVAAGTIQVEVGLVYTDDEHLAEEASVVAQLTGPAGAAVGPVDLPRISGGRYGGPVEVSRPGTWTIAVESTDPAASLTASAEVTEAPATSTTTTAPPTTGESTTTAPSTTAPTTSVAVPSDEGSASSSTAPLVVGVVGAVVVAGVASAVVLKRRRPGPGA